MDSLEKLKDILAKAKKRLSDEYDPDADEGDNELEGMTEFNPDDKQGDSADEWLSQNDPKKGKKNEKAIGQDEVAALGDAAETGSQKEEARQSGKTSQEKIKELDPERLKALKAVSPHWLSHADQQKKQSADARSNPHLFAEGHRQAAHNAAHGDFNSAYHEYINGEDYKKMSPTQKMRAEVKFKKEFQEKNPDYHKNAAVAMGKAHEMYDKAKDLHSKEMNARRAHILAGGQGSSADTFSAAEAAQHVGGQKDDEGGYTSSTIKDPAAAFASKYSDHLLGETKPVVTEAEEHESLDNPEKNIIKHPALADPKNKKLIEDFFKEYHPTIMRSASRARSQAIANGVPEDKIDMSGLHEAGMHGLMQAVHDYSPEVGSSFKAHAHGKMQGLMQSHLASQDYIPRDMRSKMKAKEKGVLSGKAPESAPPSEAVSGQTPAAPAAPKVHDIVAASGHPQAADITDRLKRADAHRSIVIRKKGQ